CFCSVFKFWRYSLNRGCHCPNEVAVCYGGVGQQDYPKFGQSAHGTPKEVKRNSKCKRRYDYREVDESINNLSHPCPEPFPCNQDRYWQTRYDVNDRR